MSLNFRSILSRPELRPEYILSLMKGLPKGGVEAVSKGAVQATIRDNPAPFDTPSLRSGYSGCYRLKLA